MINKHNFDTIEWVAPEYKHEEKSADWYWTIGLVTLIIVAISLWTKNYVFGIFVLVSGASVFLFSLRHPPQVSFAISNSGFVMGRHKYSWNGIKSFDIKEGEDYSKLLIETSKYFLPIYTIPIPNDLVDEIQKALIQIVEEKELNESSSMLLMERLGF